MNKDVYRLGAIAALALVVMGVAAGFYLRGQKAKEAAEAARKPPPETSRLERPHSRSLGPAGAKVTIVEFLDPECESCRAMYPIVKQVLAQHPDKVRLVVRYVPLHPNSHLAASALEAAGAQGRYWEMLEVMFENQPVWGSHHHPRPELIPDYAQQIGLDMGAFRALLGSADHKKIVEQDREDAQALGVRGTPTFFVNGRRLDQLGYESLKALVEEELAKAR
jgi:protein-disulfide isomerase